MYMQYTVIIQFCEYQQLISMFIDFFSFSFCNNIISLCLYTILHHDLIPVFIIEISRRAV